MEFKRDSVIVLYLAGKPQVAIVRALQHLNVLVTVILAVLQRVQKMDKKTLRTPEIIRKVKARFDRNPRLSGRKITRELTISQERVQQILKNELGLKPLKIQKVQKPTDGVKEASYRIWFSPMRSYY